MLQIFNALSRAFNDLFQFKVMWIVIWPTIIACTLWLILGTIFWGTFSGWIAEGLTVIGVQDWLASIEPVWISDGMRNILYFILFVPLIVITTLIITAIFSMPALIHLVANRYYPDLKREYGGNIVGNLVNALLATCVFVVIWVITLPLWLAGIGMVVPFVAAAYLNQQLFQYDSLCEHASREEMKSLLATDRKLLWGLGLLTGLIQFIPLLNFFAPVFAALAFIHFELARLANIRSNSNKGTAKNSEF
ncbi:MAG: EI24 domain-containing protein [Nitrosomonas sp.]|nr:EI24 domain-containing protein [Nitrosomonas sp.]MDP1950595.1 EI24 domain-containing protein [Nitrosomonas sp.]